MTGLWLGLKPSLVLTVNPAITYGMFELVKSLLLLAKEKTGGQPRLTPWQSFFVGALSKTLATVVCFSLLCVFVSHLIEYVKVTYPYIMAKVKIQAGTQNADDELTTTAPTASSKKAKKDGAVALLTRILKEDGFVGWYQVSE